METFKNKDKFGSQTRDQTGKAKAAKQPNKNKWTHFKSAGGGGGNAAQQEAN